MKYSIGEIKHGGNGVHKKIWSACESCGFERWVEIRNAGKFKLCRACSNRLPRNHIKGSMHHNWNGGERRVLGYIYKYMPEHPCALSNGYIKRARLVLEQKLGRLLTHEEVSHHKNGIKDDDRPENLEALSNSKHIKGHISNRLRSSKGQFVCSAV